MEPVGALGEYFSGSRLALAQSCSRRHHAELASACSRVRLIGAWRPLALAGGVTTAVCGFSKLAENFFKKVLDRNRRSVSIVDAPFTGN